MGEQISGIEQSKEGRFTTAARVVINIFKKPCEPDYPPAWADDRLGYWPVEDRGGSMGDFSSGRDDNGMLSTLARIELNEEDGKPLLDGLPKDAFLPKD